VLLLEVNADEAEAYLFEQVDEVMDEWDLTRN
jgi:hypothetical protein